MPEPTADVVPGWVSNPHGKGERSHSIEDRQRMQPIVLGRRMSRRRGSLPWSGLVPPAARGPSRGPSVDRMPPAPGPRSPRPRGGLAPCETPSGRHAPASSERPERGPWSAVGARVVRHVRSMRRTGSDGQRPLSRTPNYVGQARRVPRLRRSAGAQGVRAHQARTLARRPRHPHDRAAYDNRLIASGGETSTCLPMP